MKFGNLKNDNTNIIMKIIVKYRNSTQDRVDNCEDCELKYLCFDCREIAKRVYGKLTSQNPDCHYNPNLGEWGNEEK